MRSVPFSLARRTARFGWLAMTMLLCPSLARAQTVSVQPPPAVPAAQSAAPHTIEVTFGSSQLFNHQSLVAKSGRVESEIIPVSSALLMLEYLAHPRISVIHIFNLPLTTQKTVVDGELREEFVAPSVAIGARVTALSFEVFAESHLELQFAALGGFTLGSRSGDLAFPLAAGRIHFSNGAGFALYLGTAFAFRKDTVALLYGIGHRF